MRDFKQIMTACAVLSCFGLLALSCDFFESSDDDDCCQGLSNTQMVQKAYNQLDNPQGTVTSGKIGQVLGMVTKGFQSLLAPRDAPDDDCAVHAPQSQHGTVRRPLDGGYLAGVDSQVGESAFSRCIPDVDAVAGRRQERAIGRPGPVVYRTL